MHDYHQALRIVREAREEAARRGHNRVTAIHLAIGDSSGYSGEAIRMHLEEIAGGTPCEGAEIVIRPVKAMLRCENCGELFVRKPFSFECPRCGGQGSPSEIGREMAVERIDTE